MSSQYLLCSLSFNGSVRTGRYVVNLCVILDDMLQVVLVPVEIMCFPVTSHAHDWCGAEVRTPADSKARCVELKVLLTIC